MERIPIYKDTGNPSGRDSVPVPAGPSRLRLMAGNLVQIRPDYFLIQAGRLGDGRMDPAGIPFPVNNSGNVGRRYPERPGDRRLVQVRPGKSVLDLQGGHAAFFGFCIHGLRSSFFAQCGPGDL